MYTHRVTIKHDPYPDPFIGLKIDRTKTQSMQAVPNWWSRHTFKKKKDCKKNAIVCTDTPKLHCTGELIATSPFFPLVCCHNKTIKLLILRFGDRFVPSVLSQSPFSSALCALPDEVTFFVKQNCNIKCFQHTHIHTLPRIFLLVCSGVCGVGVGKKAPLPFQCRPAKRECGVPDVFVLEVYALWFYNLHYEPAFHCGRVGNRGEGPVREANGFIRLQFCCFIAQQHAPGFNCSIQCLFPFLFVVGSLGFFVAGMLLSIIPVVKPKHYHLGVIWEL